MVEVTGHRGARALFPENTLGGFRLARELGCHAVEMDVRITADGELVVIHDASIDRTTNGSGPVDGYTLKELQTFDAGRGERIPTLREVLVLLKDSELRIQIELKAPGTETAVPDLARKWGLEQRVTFTSFFHRRVLEAKRLLPAAAGGVLITCNPVEPLKILAAAGADNLHVHHRRIDADLVHRVQAAGRKIIAWGEIVETAVIDRLIGLGVDVIGSDRPDLVLERITAKAVEERKARERGWQ
jgi:glycerophosphoryl diester phosphodiesterase